MFKQFLACVCAICVRTSALFVQARPQRGIQGDTTTVGSSHGIQCCGTNFHDSYEFVDRQIGKGASGSIVLAKPRCKCPMASSTANGLVAIKRLRTAGLSPSEKRKLLQENNVHSNVDHANIVRLLRVFHEPDEVILVMEYCTGGTLSEHLLAKKKYTEAEVSRLVQQLLSAIHYLHTHKLGRICHRDLKHANLVFTDANSDDQMCLKVLDFGLTRVLTEAEPETTGFAGTLYYMAPEVVKGQSYSEACDLWSVGVIAYYLLSGTAPFFAQTPQETMDAIVAGRFKEMHGPAWEGVSEMAKIFVRDLLNVNAKTRPTAGQALQHEWLACGRHVPDQQERQKCALETLRHFTTLSTQEVAAAHFVIRAKGPSVGADLAWAERCFRSLDLNGDGRISREELSEVYRQHASDDRDGAVARVVEAVMQALDPAGRGDVGYSEFLAAFVGLKMLQDGVLRDSAFKLSAVQCLPTSQGQTDKPAQLF